MQILFVWASLWSIAFCALYMYFLIVNILPVTIQWSSIGNFNSFPTGSPYLPLPTIKIWYTVIRNRPHDGKIPSLKWPGPVLSSDWKSRPFAAATISSLQTSFFLLPQPSEEPGEGWRGNPLPAPGFGLNYRKGNQTKLLEVCTSAKLRRVLKGHWSTPRFKQKSTVWKLPKEDKVLHTQHIVEKR